MNVVWLHCHRFAFTFEGGSTAAASHRSAMAYKLKKQFGCQTQESCGLREVRELPEQANYEVTSLTSKQT